MRHFALLSPVLTVGLVVFAAAEEPQDANRDRRATFQRILDRFDKNENGRLDPPEREEAQKAFEKFRAGNRAGKNRRNGQNKKGRSNPQNREQLLRRFDANKNGRLDPAEIAAIRKAFGNRKRDNNNGLRNRGKKKGESPKRPRSDQGQKKKRQGSDQAARNPQLLRRFDANKNGRLDQPELAKMRQMRQRGGGRRRGRGGRFVDAPERENRVDQTALLERFDSNNNGQLDGAERERALAAMKKQ